MNLLPNANSKKTQNINTVSETDSGKIWAKYAQMNSGPDADMIGWLVFEGHDENNPFPNPFNNHYVEYLSYPYGYYISFDLSVTIKSDIPGNSVYATKPPTYYMAAFGNSRYLGINGPIIFYNTGIGIDNYTDMTITFSNIKVFNPDNTPSAFPYHIVLADGETTNIQESWAATTTGAPWKLLGMLPPPSVPIGRLIYRGIDTKNYYATGSSSGPMPAPVISTESPSSVTINLTTAGGREGAAIGVMLDLPNPYAPPSDEPDESDSGVPTYCF